MRLSSFTSEARLFSEKDHMPQISRKGVFALLGILGATIALMTDLSTIWQWFQPEQEIKADLLKEGLRNYLDGKK